MPIFNWSQTAATNNAADATINWAEGQAPNSVNDSARAMMAAVSKYRDDVAGSLATAGTGTAYTLTTNSVFTTTAVLDGQEIAFRAHTTSGAAPTLNVDSIGAKAIQVAAGTAITTGALLSGSVYRVVYRNASTAFILTGGPLDSAAP